jgi:hypothetical protein
VYVDSTHLYYNTTVLTAAGKDSMVAALEAGGEPNGQFPKAKQRIALADICELRFSGPGKVLEIYYGLNSPATLFGKSEPSEIYQLLRQKLAPHVVPRQGTLSRSSSASAAFIGLLLAVVMGGLFTWWASFADPNPNNHGRRAAMKDAIDLWLSKLGVWGAAGISAAVVSIFIIWFAVAFFIPRPAEVIEVHQTS